MQLLPPRKAALLLMTTPCISFIILSTSRDSWQAQLLLLAYSASL